MFKVGETYKLANPAYVASLKTPYNEELANSKEITVSCIKNGFAWFWGKNFVLPVGDSNQFNVIEKKPLEQLNLDAFDFYDVFLQPKAHYKGVIPAGSVADSVKFNEMVETAARMTNLHFLEMEIAKCTEWLETLKKHRETFIDEEEYDE